MNDSFEKKVIKTYSASERDLEMLDCVAKYHGFSKSATIASLVRKEFWRLFPAGTERIKPDKGARIEERGNERKRSGTKKR